MISSAFMEDVRAVIQLTANPANSKVAISR
jgi:hypothetical protein